MTSRSCSSAGLAPNNSAREVKAWRPPHGASTLRRAEPSSESGRIRSVLIGFGPRSLAAVSSIQISHVMGPLAIGRREMIGWKEAAPQEGLFVLAVEDDDLHGEVLVEAEEGGDFGILFARFGIEALPLDAMAFESGEGLVELRVEIFSGLGIFEIADRPGGAEHLAFAFDDEEQGFGERQVSAQIAGHLRRVAHCKAAAGAEARAGALVRLARSAWACQLRKS